MNIQILKIESVNQLDKIIVPLANVLTEAFYVDPFYEYIFPNDSKRNGQLQWIMKGFLRYSFQYGKIYYLSNLMGVALWLGPDRPFLSDLKLALLGFYKYPFKVGFGNTFRMEKITTLWSKMHKKEPKNHWYLMFIGIHPNLQGQGFGSALLNPIHQWADQERLICYLETAKARNVEFFQKNGYQVVDNLTKAIQFWTMRRNIKTKKV